MSRIDEFADWMRSEDQWSESTIYHYSHAMNTISEEMKEAKVILKDLEDMNGIEFKAAVKKIMEVPSFTEKNSRGNNMYSSALRIYSLFVSETFDYAGYENKILVSIKEDHTISETEKETLIKARIGQGLFRKKLMEKYHSACVITGIDDPHLLVASHIKPWAVSDHTEKIDGENGLLLCANMDRLFDSGLITFGDDGTLYISSSVKKENRQRLHIEPNARYDLKVSERMKQYLQYHREVLFVE